MDFEPQFKEFFSRIIPDSYYHWINANNINRRFSEIKQAYKDSFGVQNVFDVGINDLLSIRRKIMENCDKRWTVSNMAFANYSQTAGTNIPNAILHKHFVNFLSHYDSTVYTEFENLVLQLAQDDAIDIDVSEIVNSKYAETEKEALISSRRGQGEFRQKVIDIDHKCLVTGIDIPCLLVASHIKPWKESSDAERLDGNNGLFLSSHIDKLFDNHLISFSDNGKIIVYHKEIEEVLKIWGIDIEKQYTVFSDERKQHLKHHRKRCEEQNRPTSVSDTS